MRYNDMSEQRLHLDGRQEPPRAGKEERRVRKGRDERSGDGSPLVTPKPKSQIFRGRRDCLVLGYRGIALLFTKLREAEAVEFFRVRVCFSVSVNRTERERHERTR